MATYADMAEKLAALDTMIRQTGESDTEIRSLDNGMLDAETAYLIRRQLARNETVRVHLRMERADLVSEMAEETRRARKVRQLADDAESAIRAWARSGLSAVESTEAAVRRNPELTSAAAAAETDTGVDHVNVFKAWARHPEGTGRSVIRRELYGEAHISTSDARTTAQLEAGLLRKTGRTQPVQRYGAPVGRKASREAVLELTEKGWDYIRTATEMGNL